MDHMDPPIYNVAHLPAHVDAFVVVTETLVTAQDAFHESQALYDAAMAQIAGLQEDLCTCRLELSLAASTFEGFADRISVDALPVSTVDDVEALGFAFEHNFWNGSIVVGKVPDQGAINALADDFGILRLQGGRGGRGRGRGGRGRGGGRGGRGRGGGRGGHD